MFETNKTVWRAVRNHLESCGYVVSDDARVEVFKLAESFYTDGATLAQAVEWATVLVVRPGPYLHAG